MSQRTRIGVLLLSISLLTAFGASCGKEGKETANSAPIIKTEPPVKPPSDKGDSVVTGGDLAFMNAAAPGGLAEVELGKMAVEKATNADVKAFAQKMVDDHSKAGDELKKLAEQKNVKLPTDVMPTHKELMDKLSKLSGAEFDKEYVKAMVEDHKKT